MRNPQVTPRTRKTTLLSSLFLQLFSFIFAPLLIAAELPIPQFHPLDLAPLLPSVHSRVPVSQIVQESENIPQWKVVWDKARNLANQKDYPSAVEEYRRLLTIKDNLAEARWELVIILMHQNNFNQASANLDLLLEKDPNKGVYILIQSILAQNEDHFERSIELLNKVPKNTHAYEALYLSGLANALYATGKKRECLDALQNLLILTPTHTSVKSNIAVLAYDLAQFNLAQQHLVEIIDIGKSSPSLLRMAAIVHERLNNSKDASTYWQKLLDVNPSNKEAHDNLASYYEKQGNLGKALNHLLILIGKRASSIKYLKRIGQVYLGLQQFDKALENFKKYIASQPNDKEVARYVIKIHAAMGDKIETLNALEHYFAIEAQPQKQDLQQAADLYDESGFYKAAIPIYRRLLEMTPDDPELLWTLAQNLLATGQEEDALLIWRQLAEVIPGVVDIYRPIALLLERKERDRELLEVLTVIHSLEPADQQTIFKLAGYHYKLGNYDLSMKFIDKLLGEMRQRPEFFKWRGAIWASRGESFKALAEYGELLLIEPIHDEIRLQAVVLSSKVGDLTTLNRHAAYFESEKGELLPSIQVVLGQAFQACGDFSKAAQIFKKIVARALQDYESERFNLADFKQNSFFAFLGLAEIYQVWNLPFESEQVLRQGLVLSRDERFISELFGLAIADGRMDEAVEWQEYFQQLRGQKNWSASLLRAKYNQAIGKWRLAQKIGEKLQEELYKSSNEAPSSDGGDSFSNSQSDWTQKWLDLAGLFVSLEDHDKAVEIYEVLAEQESNRPATKILLHRIYKESLGFLGSSLTPQFETMGQEELLVYGTHFLKKNMYEELMEVANNLLRTSPNLLIGRLYLANAKVGFGEKQEAIKLYNEILIDTPTNQGVLLVLSNLYFETGKLPEAAGAALTLNSDIPKDSVILLQARLAWLQHKWDESIDFYLKYLTPSVEEQLHIEAEKQQIHLPDAEDERSFIEKVIQLDVKPAGIATKVMSPGFMIDNSSEQQQFYIKITSMYARFRWQNIFTRELQIRQSVQRREYVLAAKQYEAFIRSNPEDVHLLFDLAGVYSRLGRLADESALYEQLVDLKIDYPELTDSVTRNRLKQSPLVVAELGFDREEGRQGHKDMEKNWLGLKYWYSPASQTEMEVVAERINFQSADGMDVLRGNRFFSTYETRLRQGVTVAVGGGLFSLDDGDTNVLLSANLTGKFGDRLKGRVELKREVVDDTTSSLKREIVRQSLDSGLSVDLFPRLEVGGDYCYNDYSDNNWTTGYDFWSSYILFSEPTFLRIEYKYDFKESHEGEDGVVTAGSFTPDNHPYWAPKNYWTNSFGVYFKHLLSKDTLGREAPKYYTAEYYFGHDSDGYAFQTMKGAFFVEFSSSWFMKASGEVTSSQPFRNKQFVVSASYRW